MLHFPEKMRSSVFPQTTKQFEKVMNTAEDINANGKTVLCEILQKAFTGEIKRYPNLPPKQEEEKKQKEETPNQTQNEDDKK